MQSKLETFIQLPERETQPINSRYFFSQLSISEVSNDLQTCKSSEDTTLLVGCC